jgi:hypothetical protein
MQSILPRPVQTSRILFSAVAAALVTAVAAWLSQGTIAYTGAGSERIAVLPLSARAIGLAVGAGVAVFWAVRRGLSAAPVLLLGLLLLPWLPIPLPAALLLWTGPLSIFVWIAFACVMVHDSSVHVTWFVRPGARTAGVLALFIGIVAWWQVAPQVPGGDEPHYLVISQSLLKDGDLKIENNHRDRDYATYFEGQLPPDFRVRGRDQEIYSIHAPGVPALVAPAFAVAGYGGVVFFLLLISAAGSALAWHLAWVVTGRSDAAWFGWAAVTLSSTWIFHSFAVYPDGVGAVIVLTGAWALVRAEREAADEHHSIVPWVWHGAALALLPWLHTRFAVIAGGVGALVLLRMARLRNAPAKAFAFLAVPAVSCTAWLAYFIAIYGTPDPSVPYGREEGSLAFVPDGLAGLLFDQRFGLMAYAPVLLFAFIGIAIMAARARWRRHAVELLFVLVPYLVVVTSVAMWWGGRSAPARFFVPVLLWMAIPAAAAWTTISRRATRVTALGALVFTGFASAVLIFAEDGGLAFNTREAYALWLEWLNGTVNLQRALPVWWRDTEVSLFRGIIVWLAAGVAGWLVLRAFERRWQTHLATAAVLVFALAASVAAAVTWVAEDVPGRLTTPSQLDALRRLSDERRLLIVTLSPPARLARQDVAQRLTLVPELSTVPGGAGRNDRPLFSIPAVPAGEYRVRPVLRGSAGWLMIGIGRDQFAIRTVPLEAAQPSLTVTLPVDVRALIVRGDEDARRNVAGLRIEPIRLVMPEDRLTHGQARQGVRYRAATMWFLDDRSFPEPEGFWVGGARASEMVLQPDTAHPRELLVLRNGAVENTVLIETRGWREEMHLGAGEERTVQIPSEPARHATWLRITTSAGFTPSTVDSTSRDQRFLGVWVKVGN